MIASTMTIETWPINRLIPYDKNPRLNDDAVEAVARSIQEFGFRQPIVVDDEGVIIIGHTRLKAAKKLGLTEVPVHVARGLSPEKIKALRIADNKTAEIAEWNLELLPIELSELQGMDFDLGLLGFDQDRHGRSDCRRSFMFDDDQPIVAVPIKPPAAAGQAARSRRAGRTDRSG